MESGGEVGHFGDVHSEAFNDDLLTKCLAWADFALSDFSADRQVIACQYAFVFGDCCYWRLPARLPDAEWHRFGVLGPHLMFEAFIGEGVRRVEAGVGHYDYKLQLELRTPVSEQTSGGSSARWLFLMLSVLLH